MEVQRGYELDLSTARFGMIFFHEDGTSHVEWYNDIDERLLMFF